MKILLISPNKEDLPDPVAPLGLAYIAAALLDAGYRVELLDMCFVEHDEQVLAEKLSSYAPDIIGISIRNVDNASFPNTQTYLPYCKKIVSWCRTYSPSPVIVGGSGFTLMPELIIEFLEADYGIAGEAEASIMDLVNRMKNRANAEGVQGIVVPGKTFSPVSDSMNFVDLDTIAMPRRDLLDNNAYLKFGGMGNIQTKRGCAFNCIYCTYPCIEGRQVRVRSTAKVVDEMTYMKNELGIGDFFIVDNVFNYPADHAMQVCKEIIRRNLKVRWSCYCNPAFITRQLVGIMQSAGCSGIELGTDSCSGKILQNLRKNFNPDNVRNASRVCNEMNMPVCHSLLLGAPGETADTISETLDVMLQEEPTAIIIMMGIRIYPQTELALIAEQEGIIPQNGISLDPVFYLSREVASSIVETVADFAQRNPNCIAPGQNIMYNSRMQKILRGSGRQGPLWEYMDRRRRKTDEEGGKSGN